MLDSINMAKWQTDAKEKLKDSEELVAKEKEQISHVSIYLEDEEKKLIKTLELIRQLKVGAFRVLKAVAILRSEIIKGKHKGFNPMLDKDFVNELKSGLHILEKEIDRLRRESVNVFKLEKEGIKLEDFVKEVLKFAEKEIKKVEHEL